MNLEAPERLLHERFMSLSTPFRLFKHKIDWNIDVHWHEFFEIALVTEGSGTHIFNGRTLPLVKGSFFLLTPADFHGIVPEPGQTLRLYNAIFVQPYVRSGLIQWLFQNGGSFTVDLEEEDYAIVEAEFKRMWMESDQPQLGGDWIVAGALERVLIQGLRVRGDRRFPEENAQHVLHPSINKALTYLQLHFREPLTLDSVAKHAGLTANYFSECFSKQLGIPFQVYLQNLRLQFSHSLLGVTKLPITEICYASGFANLSHFERVFKHKYNCTPRQSRAAAARI